MYNGKSNIDNIFSWAPNEEQWWITGFNPEHWGNVDVTKQVMIGSIDFSEREELYEGFAKKYETDIKRNKYVILDDDRKLVWICWYEENLVK